ncbi:MAG: phosphate ABC transporter substrate-binding protein [Bdellovibrionales bacterium]|nr:phosphate ABC transporter substrate-binding protein [Bdellovibrionales bacterium]
MHNLKNIFLIFCILTTGFYTHAADKEKILITGSSTIAPLMMELARVYEKKHSDIQIDVQTGGSTKGIVDQRKHISDLGMVSRALKANESDLKGYLIARDGLGIIVNKSNPLKNITHQQVIDIYLGKINNWKQLGGSDQPIVVVHKADGRSTQEIFLKYFQLKNSQVKANIIIGDNEQGIKTVSGNKYSIGYVSVGTAQYNESAGIPIKTLSLDGKIASVENVKEKTYPLARELNIVAAGNKNNAIEDFLKFALSKEVSPIVKQYYFIPPGE